MVTSIRMLGTAVVALGALAFLTIAASAQSSNVTIETARGEATIAAKPEKLIVMDMAALDTLDLLGAKPIGVPDKLYVSHLQHFAEGTEVVGSLFEPDFETINALEPDLVVIGGRSAKQYDMLSQIAPTIDMTIWGTDMVGQAKARLAAYGTLLGKEDEAASLAADFDAKIEEAKAAVKGKGNALLLLTNGPKVSAYGAAGRFGWLYDAIDLPEAIENVEDATHGEAVSFEFIRDVNPDWLLVIDRSAAIGAEGEGARQTLDNALVQATTAWKEDQVVYLDAANVYISGGGIQSMTRTMDELIDAFGEK